MFKEIDSNSFCVVGNAPNEINKKQGYLIDSYRTIIRFNDFSLSHLEDYGKKVNIWVRATNDLVIESLEEKLNYNYDLVVIRAQSEKNTKTINFLKERGQKYFFLPIEYEQKLSKLLKAIPSTGLLFLYVLKQNNFKFKNNVFGFSFFDKKDLSYGNHHYYNIGKNKESQGIKLSKHQWDKEMKFFQREIMC